MQYSFRKKTHAYFNGSTMHSRLERDSFPAIFCRDCCAWNKPKRIPGQHGHEWIPWALMDPNDHCCASMDMILPYGHDWTPWTWLDPLAMTGPLCQDWTPRTWLHPMGMSGPHRHEWTPGARLDPMSMTVPHEHASMSRARHDSLAWLSLIGLTRSHGHDRKPW